MNPVMGVQGKGRKRILVLTSGVSTQGDVDNQWLDGDVKLHLQNALSNAGVDLFDDCWIAGALSCGTTKFQDFQIEACRPLVLQRIRELNPSVVLLLGWGAIKSVLSVAFRPNVGPPQTWFGWKIPSFDLGCWLCPTFDTKATLFALENMPAGQVHDLMYRSHIEAGAQLHDKPLPADDPREWESTVELIFDTTKLHDLLAPAVDDDSLFTFDYEGNCLKPEYPKAKLVSCATHHRGKTYAFPWTEHARDALTKVLRSSTPKGGANNKFEDRWSRVFCGTPVRNWKWDDMLSAHHLDCRKMITGVKFQAFVRLGLKPWGEDIAPFFEATGDTVYNRIEELELEKLLRYNGIDVIAEDRVARHQRLEQKLGELP